MTKTQQLNFLRRANCCFADKAYESTKMFAIGNIEKGFCAFEKAEVLHHYIQALRCSSSCESASVTLCFEDIDFNNPVESFLIQFGTYDAETSPVGDPFTPEELVEQFTLYFGVILPGVSVEISFADGCFTFTAPCGDISFNGQNMKVFLLPEIGQPLEELEEAPFTGAEHVFDRCIDEDTRDIFIERIEEQCGCCSCKDFNYELTKDTL